MNRGYVKIYRSIRDNPYCKNPKYMALWVWLLLEAYHADRDAMLGNKRIVCKPGQFTTGRKQLAILSGINQYSVERLLTTMENAHQIAQQKTTVNRLITILNWDRYQNSHNESHIDRTTTAQRSHTLKECNNDNNVKNKDNTGRFTPPTQEEASAYFKSLGYPFEATNFFEFYASKGWLVGRSPMKNWLMAANRWVKNSHQFKQKGVKDESVRDEIRRLFKTTG